MSWNRGDAEPKWTKGVGETVTAKEQKGEQRLDAWSEIVA
jgi:hypothetical protein